MRFLSRPHRTFTPLGSEQRGIRYPEVGEIIVIQPTEDRPHPYAMRVIERHQYDGELGTFPAFTLRPPEEDPDPLSANDADESVGWRSPPLLRYLPEDYPMGAESGDLIPTRSMIAQWDIEDTERERIAFSQPGKCPACGRPAAPGFSRTFAVNLVAPDSAPVSFHGADPCARAAARYAREVKQIEDAVSALNRDLDKLPTLDR